MKILENLKIKKNNNAITFEELTQKWLEYKSLSLKESTIANYEYNINKYFMDYLRDKTMLELERYDFNNIVKDLNKKLAPKSVKDKISILKSILYYAEDELKYNFGVKKIQAPRIESGDIKVLSKREKNKLEKYCLKENELTTLRNSYSFKYRFKNWRNMCFKVGKYRFRKKGYFCRTYNSKNI